MSNNQKAATSSVAGTQPLSYLNQNQPATVLREISSRAPNNNDRRYKIGTFWINRTTQEVWVLTSVINNVANWTDVVGNELTAPSEIGNSTTRETAFSTDGNMFQVYGTDGSTGSTFNKAIRGDLQVSAGDGNSSPQGIRGNIESISGAHTEELYAGFFYAQQNDGSQVDSNVIGLLGMAVINETDALDEPQVWATGVQATLAAADTAAVLTTAYQGCCLGILTYNIPFNNVGNSFVATRWGSGAGGQAGSAYKVVQTSNILHDWTYGLDLYGGNATWGYGTADMRFHNQATLSTMNGNIVVTCSGASDFFVTLGTGASKFEIQDSTTALAWKTDAFGNITQEGALAINNAGSGILIKEGANAKMGLSTLVGGTVTVNNTAVTANSRIFLTHQNNAGVPGFVSVTAVVAATSFTITSSNAGDTSNIAWLLIEAI